MGLLTGKCKEDFEKWFADEIEKSEQKLTVTGRILIVEDFYKRITFSMQYGVYVDFFDENNIKIKIDPLYDMSGTNRVQILDIGIQCKTRNEARIAAIKKANELYNEY